MPQQNSRNDHTGDSSSTARVRRSRVHAHARRIFSRGGGREERLTLFEHVTSQLRFISMLISLGSDQVYICVTRGEPFTPDRQRIES